MDEQTTEQRNNAIRDAQTIDSSVLSPSAPEIRPVEPIVPDVPILQATEPEKEVSAAQKRIAELNLQTVGESARRTTLEGEADIEGKIAINPSGGLKSKGHPIGATGAGQVYEVTKQLRGEVEPERLVEGAKIGMTDTLGGDGGTLVNLILKRGW